MLTISGLLNISRLINEKHLMRRSASVMPDEVKSLQTLTLSPSSNKGGVIFLMLSVIQRFGSRRLKHVNVRSVRRGQWVTMCIMSASSVSSLSDRDKCSIRLLAGHSETPSSSGSRPISRLHSTRFGPSFTHPSNASQRLPLEGLVDILFKFRKGAVHSSRWLNYSQSMSGSSSS